MSQPPVAIKILMGTKKPIYRFLCACACSGTLPCRHPAIATMHRAGQWLEAFKFGIYLATPVAAMSVASFGGSGLLEVANTDRAYATYPPELRDREHATDRSSAAQRADE